LKNSEALFQTARNSIEILYDSQGAVVEQLSLSRKNLDKAALIDPWLASSSKRIAEIAFNVEDIAEELRTYLKKIEMDENRLAAVEDRLDVVNKLSRKYGGSLDAVFLRLESIEHELSNLESLSEDITVAETRLSSLHHKLVELTTKLSKKRKKAGELLAKKVEKELASLKMPKTQFRVSFKAIPADGSNDPYLTAEKNVVHETGIDQVVFLIAPNVGEPLKPLSSIVSGGELSRVVLALKAILAQTEAVETIVFDEVDAGIGGGVAEVVGKKLAALAKHHQIICITHLPQIAKFGNHHFSITKHVSKGRTVTSINYLSQSERINEIARMLGGEKITRATYDHAREMLNRVHQ
jgi:DNA repair protein RecN (Recombination protein N)